MKRVAVLGGGPAGAFAAERLASAGLEVIIVDEKPAWEKPCGGGLTYRAYHRYPFLIDSETPKRLVGDACLSSGPGTSARLTLSQPLLIYSRLELNRMLLERAEKAGARFEQARVLQAQRSGSGWSFKTTSGEFAADHCIAATGARNNLRHIGTSWSSSDTMIALGFYIPIERQHIDIRFFPRFEGYIWIFPRMDHVSAGICAKRESARALRQRLEQYLSEQNIPLDGASFYAHVLPSLEADSWESNRVAGDGWMAVGDAAGLVDPVTGEGLYYALRSAELASNALIAGGAEPQYREDLRREVFADLKLASRLTGRFYRSRFLGGAVTERMIQFARRSPTVCAVLQDLFAGTQEYTGLKARLRKDIPATTLNLFTSLTSKALR